MEKRPFEGLKVLDFTWGGVGPFQTNFLAYFGAMVVRIESAARPDVTRQGGNMNPRAMKKFAKELKDPRKRLEFGPAFAVTHPVKKYGISLNLNKPEAVEILKKLEDYEDWEKLIHHCQIIEDLSEFEKEKAKRAFQLLRQEFGEKFLHDAFENNHPICGNIRNLAPWTRKWIIWFADALKEVKSQENY